MPMTRRAGFATAVTDERGDVLRAHVGGKGVQTQASWICLETYSGLSTKTTSRSLSAAIIEQIFPAAGT